MIEFSKFVLPNGLRVIHHFDANTSQAAVNVLYNVGARDENPEQTGFAHLFEHLMFGGSVNIPNYDIPVQNAGGENNAFTSNDITNYYIQLPVNNIETALWLESDRMMLLDFNEKSLAVQKGVVVEEFRQRYLNQPYGDAWLKLRPLAYEVHPYRWATIGKEIEHISNAKLSDVEAFFKKFYHPANAILCIGGNISLDETKRLVQKWFGDLEGREPNKNIYSKEPVQTQKRILEIDANVPQNSIYMAFKMCSRLHPDYAVYDLISDILSRGDGAVLYQKLVKDKQIFTEIHAYVTGSLDDGLWVIQGKTSAGITCADAETEVWNCVAEFCSTVPEIQTLEKEKNKSETAIVFNFVQLLNKAMELCFFENMGDASMINNDLQKYRNVTPDDVHRVSKQLFNPNSCSVLYYNSI